MRYLLAARPESHPPRVPSAHYIPARKGGAPRIAKPALPEAQNSLDKTHWDMLGL